MATIAIQDTYPDDVAWCYGCGRLNEKGLHVRTFAEGDEYVATVVPRAEHTAVPGYVYGGLIASAIDCQSTGVASAAAHRAAGYEPGDGPAPRFLTGTLKVEYLRPTPIDAPMELRSRVVSRTEKKAVITTELRSKGELCARGEAVAVRMPEGFPGR
jgi:acyl-coenzyme A thioesterase PaaI-like protein